MRLDHLLSKELWQRLPPVVGGGGCPGLCLGRTCRGQCSRVEHRLWLIASVVGGEYSCPVRWGDGKLPAACGVWGLGALLGPEGTDESLFVQVTCSTRSVEGDC